MGQEMKGREFYQAIKERRAAGTPELTAATILDGPQAGGKFLLRGKRRRGRSGRAMQGQACSWSGWGAAQGFSSSARDMYPCPS